MLIAITSLCFGINIINCMYLSNWHFNVVIVALIIYAGVIVV